jgi:hypothetical protein
MAGWLASVESKRTLLWQVSHATVHLFSSLSQMSWKIEGKNTQKFGNCVTWRNCRSSLSFKMKHFSLTYMFRTCTVNKNF